VELRKPGVDGQKKGGGVLSHSRLFLSNEISGFMSRNWCLFFGDGNLGFDNLVDFVFKNGISDVIPEF
jgi:hypothetical protein